MPSIAELTDLSKLITLETRDTILQKMLDIADALGLKTETWGSGDPTRSLFTAISNRFADTWEPLVVAMIKGGFLGLAEGDWLELLLRYNFNVEIIKATYATCTVRLTNNGTANIGAIGLEAVTVRNPTTGATYRNTTTGTLGPGPGSILDLEFTAEVAGSGGTSGVGAISQLVTTIQNVTISNTTAATGVDKETDDNARKRGQAKLESLSPNGPKGAYFYAVTTPELQTDGVTNITRAKFIEDSNTGIVTGYLAGASGAVVAGDVTKAQTAINTWARPLCVGINVSSAVNKSQAITYTLYVYNTISKTSAQIQTDVQTALLAAIAKRPIGGDTDVPGNPGVIYKSWIESTILNAVAPHGYRCNVTTPSGDISMLINEVLVAGTITPTVNIIAPS